MFPSAQYGIKCNRLFLVSSDHRKDILITTGKAKRPNGGMYKPIETYRSVAGNK